MQIADGLAAAAKLGLVHRDIKPANILLENGVERVKITDFGLARTADDASVSQSGTVAGTPMYMSPEQANGEQVDHRSDLFSLGSVLYVMCTGRPPFRATSTMAVMRRVCDDTPTPVQQLNPDIPDWLGDIIAKLHAKKPSERFQSAMEVAELLGQHLARIHEPTAQTPVARTTSTLIPAPAATAVKSGAVQSAFRQMLPWLGAGGLVMGMLAVFLVLYSLHKPPEQTTVHLKADDVLKSLVGTWQVEFETTLPKFKMTHGIAGYTWVGNEKFLRGYICYDDGSETLAVFSRDAQSKTFRYWSLSSAPGLLAIQGPGEGQWDATTTTLILQSTMPLSRRIVHEYRWIDGDNLESRVEMTDHQGAVVLRQTKKMHRITSNEIVGPKLPKDSKGPPELAVLERMVGSWKTANHITLAELGDRKVQSQSTHEVVPILAGRFFEAHEHTQPGDRTDYWLVGYDENRRIYRHWHFGAGGEAMEADGAWDVKTSKMTWRSLDGRLEGSWTFPKPDERHATMAAKDAQGRRLYDVAAVARRDAAPPSGWVQLFNAKDLRGWDIHPASKGTWRVDTETRTLIGSGGETHLYSNRADYENFHFRVEAKINDGGNSGQYFRCAPRGAGSLPAGYEAQINSTHKDPVRTGSLWHLGLKHAVTKILVPPDTWFTQEVIANGNRIIIKVNGKTTVDYVDEDKKYSRGQLALQVLEAATVVHFKRVEIKELPPSQPNRPSVLLAEKGILDYAEIHDADENRFDAWIAQMKKDGYRPVSLSVQTVKEAPRYTSVAIKEETNKVWEFARVRNDDDKHRDAMRKKEYVAIAQCLYLEKGLLHQAYLWVLNPNTLVDGIWSGSKDDIDNKIDEARKRKARPVFRSALQGAATVYDIIIGDPGKVPWVDLVDQSLEVCKTSIERQKAQGWRPVHLYAYGAGRNTLFGAILIQEPKAPDWDVSWALTPAQYEAELAERKRRGFRPHTAVGHDDDAGATRFSVLWIRYFDPATKAAPMPP